LYYDQLTSRADIPIKPVGQVKDATHVYHLYVVKSLEYSRDQLKEKLAKGFIHARVIIEMAGRPKEYVEESIAAYLDKIKAEAGQKGYTETLFGRRRYFEGLKSPLPYVRAQAERMAINAPIQGTQADLIKIAMKRIDEYIKSEKHEDDIRLILQVHDELVYEVKDSLVNEAVKLFKQLMETVLPEDKTFSVPIIAEVSAGDNWGEMRHI